MIIFCHNFAILNDPLHFFHNTFVTKNLNLIKSKLQDNNKHNKQIHILDCYENKLIRCDYNVSPPYGSLHHFCSWSCLHIVIYLEIK